MKISVALMAAIPAFLFPIAAGAGGSYKCTIKDAVSITDDGHLEPDKFRSTLIDHEFVVDRETGRIIGALTNHNVSGTPQVVDQGSNSQAFKVLTIYQPNTWIDYLYVQEFAESDLKPFMFIDGSAVISGTCVTY